MRAVPGGATRRTGLSRLPSGHSRAACSAMRGDFDRGAQPAGQRPCDLRGPRPALPAGGRFLAARRRHRAARRAAGRGGLDPAARLRDRSSRWARRARRRRWPRSWQTRCLRTASTKRPTRPPRYSEEHAPASDIVTQVLWRMARARALAEQESAAAEELARRAAALAPRHGLSRPQSAGRSRALRRCSGQETSSRRSLDEAPRGLERKGNVAAVARLPIGSVHPA